MDLTAIGLFEEVVRLSAPYAVTWVTGRGYLL